MSDESECGCVSSVRFIDPTTCKFEGMEFVALPQQPLGLEDYTFTIGDVPHRIERTSYWDLGQATEMERGVTFLDFGGIVYRLIPKQS